MPAKKLNNETREDYQFEQLRPASSSDIGEEWARETAEKTVAREDELIWAWYRDPKTDLTQVEARDRAQHGRRYPQKYQIGQSSVSRKIGRLDDNMLTEPLLQLNMEQVPEDDRDEHDTVGFLARYEFQQLKRWRFIAFLDAWRESIARFICDMHSLSLFFTAEQKTPEWAMQRFSELDPNIGREFYDRLDGSMDLHSEQQKQVTNAD
jgi:hypothetical protein